MQAGGGAGERMFPKSGSKAQVQEWFVHYKNGMFSEFKSRFSRYGGPELFEVSQSTFEKTLKDALDAEVLFNAIHKHDPAATTGTAATGRCSIGWRLWATLWCVSGVRCLFVWLLLCLLVAWLNRERGHPLADTNPLYKPDSLVRIVSPRSQARA
jgi:hypothetical protein